MSEISNICIVLLLIFILVFILLLVRRTRTKSSSDYDERQELIRGKAYKYAFMYCLICSFVLGGVLEFTGISPYISSGAALLIIAFLGLTIFVDYCIANDAFYSLNQNKRWFIGLCILVTISTGISSFDTISSSGFHGGLKMYNTASLLCMILFLNILIVMAVKAIIARKRGFE